MPSFKAPLEIIGVNPFVFVPDQILAVIFAKAGKDKGPVPVCGTVNRKKYRQTLVRYRGEWRLYINTSMLQNSPKRIGEIIAVTIQYDPADRSIAPHPLLLKALNKNKAAKKAFENLIPSRKKEIIRYISFLKSEEALVRNIERAIGFLNGKDRFIGRNNP